jgi:ribonuclease-3
VIDLTSLFNDRSLLDQALSHPSYSHIHGTTSYDRLEFLGDRVINLLICKIIYQKFPTLVEGELAVMQASFGSTKMLAHVATTIGLDKMLKLDPSEEARGGRQNLRNLENTIEAFFGALFLDQGFDVAYKVGHEIFAKVIEANHQQFKDPKSQLQEYSQKRALGIPKYEVISQSGPSHEPIFEVLVEVEGLGQASAFGKNKKEAEFSASQKLINKLITNTDGN